MVKMVKNNGLIILIAIIALVIIGMFVQKNYAPMSISGTETLSRTSSATTVNPSATFILIYTAMGVVSPWGASVTDTISGGCTIDGKTSLKFVMMSYLPNPLTYTVTAPASGSCTLHGDYQYGSFPIQNLPDLTIQICQQLTSSDLDCNGIISRTELRIGIENWINGQETRNQLGIEINSWASN